MDSRLAAYIASLPPNGVQRPLFPLAGTAAPSGSFWQQVRAAGLVWRSGTLLGVHALETVFLFASWAAEGSGALSGRVDKGWLAAWALCLATVVLLRAAARSSEVALSIGFGGLLKERLLVGAMAFDADALRRNGIGELLSQVFEAEALEGVATDGGLQIVLAALELLIIPLVLSWGVSAGLEITLLLSWVCLTSILVAQNMRERFRDRKHTSELQSLRHLVCRLLLEKKKSPVVVGDLIKR